VKKKRVGFLMFYATHVTEVIFHPISHIRKSTSVR